LASLPNAGDTEIDGWNRQELNYSLAMSGRHRMHDERLRVLFVPSWYPSAWVATQGLFFRDQAVALRRAGVEVGIIYPDLRSLRSVSVRAVRANHFQSASLIDAGVQTVRWNGWNAPGRRIRVSLFSAAAERLARRYLDEFGKPTLLHAQGVYLGGLAADKIARTLQIPFVVTEHSSAFPLRKIPDWADARIKQTFRRAASVLAVSDFLAKSVQPWVDDRQVSVIPNMVDTSYFRPPSEPRPRNPFVVLTIAHMQAAKALDLLIRAFAVAFRARQDVVLVLGGAGEQLRDLRGVVSTLNLEKQVRFLGPLTREKVREALWRANLYVSSSRVETFGTSLIEAMATGLPVVSTASGGPQEIVSGGTGWLIPPDDERALTEGLRLGMSKVLGGIDEQHIRGEAARRFGEDAFTSALLAEYRDVVDRAKVL
jgi:glycosyltransferase involved in cell wall biosynthesis